MDTCWDVTTHYPSVSSFTDSCKKKKEGDILWPTRHRRCPEQSAKNIPVLKMSPYFRGVLLKLQERKNAWFKRAFFARRMHARQTRKYLTRQLLIDLVQLLGSATHNSRTKSCLTKKIRTINQHSKHLHMRIKARFRPGHSTPI